MNDQKNLILAIVASVIIMVGFQYFVEKPKLEKARQQQAEMAQPQVPGAAPAPQAPAVPGMAPSGSAAPSAPSAQRPGIPAPPSVPSAPASGVPVAPGAPAGGKPVIAGPRIDIASKSLRGSIALTGGAIDDIVLKGYRETLQPESENIRLFAPSGGPAAYYAEHGWFATDPQVKVPGPDTLWTSSGGTLAPGKPVTLSWDNGTGLRFTRTYAVDDEYMFTVTQRVQNTGTAAVTLAPYALVNRTGTPKTQGFYILHEGPLGVFNGTLEEFNYDDVAEAKQIAKTSTGGWIGITDKYWLAALVPVTDAKISARFLHWRAGNQDKYQVDFSGAARALPPGGSTDSKSYLFSGAKEVRVLDAYSESLGITNFDLAIDFGWFYFLTKPFFYLLDILSMYLGNFGLAILAVTVLVKLLFFPLANKSYKSMSAMKKLQPKMAEIKERFGSDKQRMNQEVMELYKREKVNPASSCLPILIQIPVFFALYKVLFVSIEMRHAPFYGWIKDLSAPDPTSFINLFGLLPFAVPDFIPHVISIGAWLIVMGILMFLQMKLNPPPPDPIQARIFMFMPVFFTFIMAPFP
ncbi:MAG: membrane protein insertase YidC, partial [Alphaproteobacteria bacterium]